MSRSPNGFMATATIIRQDNRRSSHTSRIVGRFAASRVGGAPSRRAAATQLHTNLRRTPFTRLVIDARMLDHSGIGTYLTNVLPGVLARCETLRPLLLTLPGLLPRARDLAGSFAETNVWASLPLSPTDWGAPRGLHRDVLWWSPHFNLPIFASAPAVVT